MNLAGRNNPCGTKEQDRDASDWGKVIPVEQKSKLEMNPGGRNNPCGAKEQERDADQFKFDFISILLDPFNLHQLKWKLINFYGILNEVLRNRIWEISKHRAFSALCLFL